MAPKARSDKWISTSVAETAWDSHVARYCSAEYQVNNMISPVRFHEALQKVPDDAIVVEVRA